jgi:hypothetical protein
MDIDELNRYSDENPLPSDLVTLEVPEGFHLPKWDSINGVWVEGKAPVLADLQSTKLAELYNAYQAELNGQVISSLVGADNANIVFSYTAKDRDNYRSIGLTFALDANQTESIIGSDSHGKFYIQRADFLTLTKEFQSHEVDLYMKFKQKEAEVNGSGIDTIDSIVW